MARYFIVVGDPTSGGGVVLTGSPVHTIDGLAIACVGDQASCSVHGGKSTIVSGYHGWILDGRAIACEGDQLSCGCWLISERQRTASCTDYNPKPSAATTLGAGQKTTHSAPHRAEKKAICEECLLAAASNGNVFLER